LSVRIESARKEMEVLTKAAAVLALIAILVVLVTPAPDELPGLPHKHRVSTAVALPQTQKSLPASGATTVVGNGHAPTLVSSTDMLSLVCTRLC
jgi:hypothetical protein